MRRHALPAPSVCVVCVCVRHRIPPSCPLSPVCTRTRTQTCSDTLAPWAASPWRRKGRGREGVMGMGRPRETDSQATKQTGPTSRWTNARLHRQWHGCADVASHQTDQRITAHHPPLGQAQGRLHKRTGGKKWPEGFQNASHSVAIALQNFILRQPIARMRCDVHEPVACFVAAQAEPRVVTDKGMLKTHGAKCDDANER